MKVQVLLFTLTAINLLGCSSNLPPASPPEASKMTFEQIVQKEGLLYKKEIERLARRGNANTATDEQIREIAIRIDQVTELATQRLDEVVNEWNKSHPNDQKPSAYELLRTRK